MCTLEVYNRVTMNEKLSHKDFIEGMKEKRIRLVFNPFLSVGLWKTQLPMKYWGIQGLAFAFCLVSIFFGLPALLIIGRPELIFVLVLLLVGIMLLYNKYSASYVVRYAIKNEEFYNYGINTGMLFTEELKNKKKND